MMIRGGQLHCCSGKISCMFEHDDAPPPSMADVLDSPDAVAAELATGQPGPGHDAALAMLDPAVLSDAGRIDLLVALERQIAWLAARQQRVLASLDGRALDWQGKQSIDYTREQVGVGFPRNREGLRYAAAGWSAVIFSNAAGER
jgi:hypothetical protein